MSTQSIKEHTLEDLRNSVDKALACIGKGFILEDRFGIKNKLNKKDLFTLIYYKRFLKQRYCKEDITVNLVDKLNKTLIKYN